MHNTLKDNEKGHAMAAPLAVMKNLSESSLDVLYHTAYTCYKQGRYGDAESFFRLLTIANARVCKYWMGLGLSLQCGKKYAEAIDAYKKIAIFDENNFHTHLQAAECFFMIGNEALGLNALDCAERILKRQNDPEEAQQIRIDLLRAAWKPKRKK